MSKRGKGILQSDGSYCYTGVNCRRHSVFNQIVSTMGKDFEPATFLLSLSERIDNFRTELCQREDDIYYPSLSDVISLQHATSAVYCDEHKSFHPFSGEELHNLVHEWKDEIHKKIFQTMRERKLDRYIASQFYVILSEKFLYRESKNRPEILNEVKINTSKIAKLRKDYRGAVQEELLVNSKEISEDALLLWYQCHRKIIYSSYDEANTKETQNSIKMPYLCPHCQNWHVGGGNGATPISRQLIAAKETWDSGTYRSRVNSYVKNTNITNINSLQPIAA